MAISSTILCFLENSFAPKVVFVLLPWVVFLAMAALPLTLCITQMPRIQATKLRAEGKQVKAQAPRFIEPGRFIISLYMKQFGLEGSSRWVQLYMIGDEEPTYCTVTNSIEFHSSYG